MSIVARGHVRSRPFARSVHWISAKRFTGDLVMTQDGMTYMVTWHQGKVIAAHSTSPSDTWGRIALTAGMVTSTQLGDLLRRAAGQPDRDPLALLVEAAQLSREQVADVKRRALVHRALRIFALDQASFVLDDAPTLAADPDLPPMNGRWLIYHGLRSHYTEERLEVELAPAAGARLRLTAEDQARLGEFGFSPADRRALARLSERMGERGLSLGEIPAVCPEMPRKAVLAMVYALLATDGITAMSQAPVAAQQAAAPPQAAPPQAAVPPQAAAPPQAAPPAAPRPAPGAPPAPPPRMSVFTPGFGVPQLPRSGAAGAPQSSTMPPGVAPPISRMSIPSPVFGSPVVTQPAAPAAGASAPRPSPGPAAGAGAPAPAAPGTRSVKLAASRKPPASPAPTADEIRALIQSKLIELDEGADYYRILGVEHGIPDSEIRTTYFELARKLHPDRLRAIGITDLPAESQRLFSQINQAFSVLGNPQKRAKYNEALRSGTGKGNQRDPSDAESYAARILAAEEHFLRGEMALRRQVWQDALAEFQRAAALNPDEADHIAMLGWATWCAAADKEAALSQVQGMLERALEIAPKNVRAIYYRGRIASMRGDAQAALALFERVLKINPRHQEAALEARVLQKRLDKGNKRDQKGGLFERLKRR